MLNLVTGTPGAGKTLLTIDRIIKEYPDRPVYFNNVKLTEKGREALPNWSNIDEQTIQRWFELPAGSLIFLDECQFIFPVRKRTDQVPTFVEKLTTHRHLGLDFMLITQHPHLIDTYVRKLIDRHTHYSRQLGLESVKRYEWEELADVKRDVGTATIKRIKYPKKIYKLYKSAEVHTVKKRIPVQLYYVIAGIALLVALLYFLSTILFKATETVENEQQSETESVIPITKTVSTKETPSLPWYIVNHDRIYKTGSNISGLDSVYEYRQKSGESGIIPGKSRGEPTEELIRVTARELTALGYTIVPISECLDVIIRRDSRDYTICKPQDNENDMLPAVDLPNKKTQQ
jgi:hypothetical protein